MNTEIFFDTYKGFPVLAVWEIDELGNKKGKAPIVSFGVKKARAILNHQERIERWVRDQESDSKIIMNENKSITEKILNLLAENKPQQKI